MSRAAVSFTKAAITRAVEAVQAAGEKVARVEIEGGRIVIVTAGPALSAPDLPFDQWKAGRGADQA